MRTGAQQRRHQQLLALLGESSPSAGESNAAVLSRQLRLCLSTICAALLDFALMPWIYLVALQRFEHLRVLFDFELQSSPK